MQFLLRQANGVDHYLSWNYCNFNIDNVNIELHFQRSLDLPFSREVKFEFIKNERSPAERRICF